MNTRKNSESTKNNPGLFQDIDALVNETLEKASFTLELLAKYRSYCQQESLCYSETAVTFVQNQIVNTISFLEQLKIYDNSKDKTELLIEQEAGLRVARQSIAAANLYLNWRSPSCSQSVVPQFFDLDSKSGEDIYERYGFKEIRRIEKQLLELMELNEEDYFCTVVNSGMAAYTLVESYLIRNILNPGDCIVTSPYMFYESMEQMIGLKEWVQVVRVEDYDINNFIKAIDRYQPKVIFVELLANTADQRMVDLHTLLDHCKQLINKPLLVVDSSTTPCSLPFFINNYDNIIYFESCSKYLQFGLDMTLAGYIVYRAELKKVFEKLRRNMGLILTEYGAHLFPKYDRDRFLGRLKRIENNARVVSQRLVSNSAINKLCDIFHISLEFHPDNLLATNIGRYGGCVTFKFKEDIYNNKETFEMFMSLFLEEANKKKLPISTGASYGFSSNRIAIAILMAQSMGVSPYIRLWLGDQDYDININTADLIANVLLKTVQSIKIITINE